MKKIKNTFAIFMGMMMSFTLSAQELPEELIEYRKVIKSMDVELFSSKALALRQFTIANEPNYPTYHFAGPESSINDPNGPIYYKGKYHVFYQSDPYVSDGKDGWVKNPRTWGHAVSEDLVHWTDWPIPMWPEGVFDKCIFSGNTFVDHNGDLCGIYTGTVSGTCPTVITNGVLARSKNEGLSFTKKLVMTNEQRPHKCSPVHWDAQIWEHDGLWYQLIGGASAVENRHGAAWIWTSPDLENWTLRSNIASDIKYGSYWELPYLIELDGKHVLFAGCGNIYWIGHFDYETLKFTPDNPKPQSVDNGNYYSFNLNLTDDKGLDGKKRQLMLGWVVTHPGSTTMRTEQYPMWWLGAHTIPRVIRIKDDKLFQEPIPEIESLRRKNYHFDQPEREEISSIEGDNLEIIMDVDFSKKSRFCFDVKVGLDDEKTSIVIDKEQGFFSVAGKKQGIVLPEDQYEVRIFVDRSIVEVFINGYAMTRVTFLKAGRHFLATEDAESIKSMDVWKMDSIWPGAVTVECCCQ